MRINTPILWRCEGKKTTLLQAEARAFELEFANVLFCAWGVVFLNAPIRRKERGGKKLKSLAVNFESVEIFSVIWFGFFKVALRYQNSDWLAPNNFIYFTNIVLNKIRLLFQFIPRTILFLFTSGSCHFHIVSKFLGWLSRGQLTVCFSLRQ